MTIDTVIEPGQEEGDAEHRRDAERRERDARDPERGQQHGTASHPATGRIHDE